jgi:phytoene dehydrogenase-like protein
MQQLVVDAAVIGAGPNGLVAACALADAGWDVVVLEAAGEVGGAVRSADVVPGHVHDLFSSFYPLAAASPVIGALRLEEHGLRWSQAPAVLTHLGSPDDEVGTVLHRRPEDTAAGLEAEHPGDGDTWLRLVEHYRRIREPLLDALFSPFPPLRAAGRLLGRLGARDALETARLLALPVHRLGEELFGGEGGRALLAGNAMHADVPAVAPVSGGFGWLLAMLGQDVGFPVPVGGAGRLSGAMADRARAAGAQLRTGAPVERVVVHGGRALGVLCADGTAVRARRAVLASCPVTTLFGTLIDEAQVPNGVRRALRRFQWDLPTVKVNWAMHGRVPWRAAGAASAGTVHLGTDSSGLAEWSTSLGIGRPSEHTFALVGQMAVADPSRAPAGGESLWAYSHLPRGQTDPKSAAELAERMQALVEAHAPGFAGLVRHRFVQTPADLQAADGSLRHGALNGGTAQLQQQLVFRPVPGTGRPETAIAGLYLAGAGAHPGGGVHGAAGWLAARAALDGARLGGLQRRALVGAQRRLQALPSRPMP